MLKTTLLLAALVNSAVSEYRSVSTEAQDIIFTHHCIPDGEIKDSRNFPIPLLKEYLRVEEKLGALFDATEGTDGEVEGVEADFCQAVLESEG